MRTTKQILRFLRFVTLFSTSVSICAAERFLMNFEFGADGKIINKGNAIVSIKKKTWQKGLQRNFLKLICQPNKSGKIKKIYSTGSRSSRPLAKNKQNIPLYCTSFKTLALGELKKVEGETRHPTCVYTPSDFFTTYSSRHQVSLYTLY